jgi:Rieske Fe-S protein
VPVGGALVLSAEHLVVTQPTAGEFHCFSSACTHAGCTVRAGTTLVCPCHGSRFALADGAVLQGPADAPLPERRITVSGDEIRLA